jgi:hypothetical protein
VCELAARGTRPGSEGASSPDGASLRACVSWRHAAHGQGRREPRAHALLLCTAWRHVVNHRTRGAGKSRIGTGRVSGGRDRSRGRFATPADLPLHDCSPCTEGYTHAAKVCEIPLCPSFCRRRTHPRASHVTHRHPTRRRGTCPRAGSTPPPPPPLPPPAAPPRGTRGPARSTVSDGCRRVYFPKATCGGFNETGSTFCFAFQQTLRINNTTEPPLNWAGGSVRVYTVNLCPTPTAP